MFWWVKQLNIVVQLKTTMKAKSNSPCYYLSSCCPKHSWTKSQYQQKPHPQVIQWFTKLYEVWLWRMLILLYTLEFETMSSNTITFGKHMPWNGSIQNTHFQITEIWVFGPVFELKTGNGSNRPLDAVNIHFMHAWLIAEQFL